MQHLNLPAYGYKLKHSAEQTFIFDNVRRKYVFLTHEEWVRQHFLNYLIHYLAYPRTLIAVERGTKYNQLAKRTDLCVYDNAGRPLLLVECKAPDVLINQSVVKQATIYNKTIGARFVVLTNGLDHFCWEVDFNSATIQPLENIPAFPEINNPGE